MVSDWHSKLEPEALRKCVGKRGRFICHRTTILELNGIQQLDDINKSGSCCIVFQCAEAGITTLNLVGRGRFVGQCACVKCGIDVQARSAPFVFEHAEKESVLRSLFCFSPIAVVDLCQTAPFALSNRILRYSQVELWC